MAPELVSMELKWSTLQDELILRLDRSMAMLPTSKFLPFHCRIRMRTILKNSELVMLRIRGPLQACWELPESTQRYKFLAKSNTGIVQRHQWLMLKVQKRENVPVYNIPKRGRRSFMMMLIAEFLTARWEVDELWINTLSIPTSVILVYEYFIQCHMLLPRLLGSARQDSEFIVCAPLAAQVRIWGPHSVFRCSKWLAECNVGWMSHSRISTNETVI